MRNKPNPSSKFFGPAESFNFYPNVGAIMCESIYGKWYFSPDFPMRIKSILRTLNVTWHIYCFQRNIKFRHRMKLNTGFLLFLSLVFHEPLSASAKVFCQAQPSLSSTETSLISHLARYQHIRYALSKLIGLSEVCVTISSYYFLVSS